MGFKLLLVGDTGTGKTTSWIKDALDAGMEVFYIFTENGVGGLKSHLAKNNIPITDKLHWAYIPVGIPSWDKMIGSSKLINTLDFKSLASTRVVDRTQFSEFIGILSTMQNYKCQNTGKEYGGVDSWGDDKILAIDSLTGLSEAAMNLVIGDKPTKELSDWMVAGGNLDKLILKLANGCQCNLVMTAHPEREMDEITGGTTITVSTLGRKLAPKIPRNFDDCVCTIRKGEIFTWSNMEYGYTCLKNRYLPLKNTPPAMKQLIEAYRKAAK